MASENQRLVLRIFLELWNNGKLAVTDEIFSANYAHHDPASPDFGRDRRALSKPSRSMAMPFQTFSSPSST
jgi:predicted SnoaL-like aldol condensation-catalyzing enzyme